MVKTKKKPPQNRTMPRVTLTLDIETLDRLKRLRDATPDIMSVSAAVRYLARREDERSRAK